MKIFVSFLVLLFSVSAFSSCDFKSDVKKVVSFSGSTTVIFKELRLLSKLSGISIFNPIGEKEFTGRVYPGGIFLAQSTLSDLSGSVVFYDESRELSRIFSPISSIQSREIKTRNLTPYESHKKVVGVVSEFLSGCEKDLARLDQKIKDLETKLLQKIPNNLTVVFYIGEFKNSRRPEMVVVEDGVVKWLVQQKKIKTYPSTLSYINWSTKLMREMPKNTLHVAIKDSGRDLTREIKKSPQGVTLVYPGSLVPGISQLEAFLYWAETL